MSKQFNIIENALNLEDLDTAIESQSPVPTTEDVAAALAQANNLEKQFDKMNGYDLHDVEMDELASLAIEAHKDLQELGMSVEIKHAGEIFSSSSQMLKIAVDAKNNKVEKKLKLLRLQLDKMRIDKMNGSENNNTLDGNAVTLNRNEMLRQLRQMNSNDTNQDK